MKDEAKFDITALRTPVCATYGRFNYGPKYLLIAGPGTAWKYSYVNNKLTHLEMDPKLSNTRRTAAGTDYVIHWLDDHKTYKMFYLKKMKWSNISGQIKIGKTSGIIPMHVSLGVCAK